MITFKYLMDLIEKGILVTYDDLYKVGSLIE